MKHENHQPNCPIEADQILYETPFTNEEVSLKLGKYENVRKRLSEERRLEYNNRLLDLAQKVLVKV